MKHIWMVLICCVAVLLIAVPANSQIENGKLGVKFSNLTYAASAGIDTSSQQYMAGARCLSLVITTADSAELDVVVQYKTNGTWTAILTDSLITTTAAGATQEYSIKDGDSDLCDGLYYPLRVIVGGQATGCGTTTPTFTAYWYYRL